MSEEEQTESFNVRLTVEQIATLRTIAKQNERTAAAEIRLAVRRHLQTQTERTK